jgi:hypothetical protein
VPRASYASRITLYGLFRNSAKGFAEMHGKAKRQINKNNELWLAWQMQLYIARSK